MADKQHVHDFWNEASCGESLYLQGSSREAYETQARKRYELEPYIPEFARFDLARGKRVLEIGVGLGSDHQRFAQAGADLTGIDLTERAIQHTARRLAAFGLSSRLEVGDAERLEFPDESFDCVYSWGVLHHSPDTPKAVSEVWRVLKRGGMAGVMIYHKWSLVGLMLWIRYALLGFQPWLSPSDVYARYLESPGTKAYSVKEARQLFSAFNEVSIHVVLTHGDLLESMAGQRHQGALLSLARRIWPRALIRRFLPGMGLFMLIEAQK
ncbi:MAG TPA: methyltransferase domain-containing protein [Bradyrhizobium sp.]|nr:methyltransferase domain-containing protein [Bradyrhizobium sp.]